ncbi:MAG: hypothetical protein NC324_02575 [Bacteroides sp.]|nr:hypothetical protein [Bacteroides sp.]
MNFDTCTDEQIIDHIMNGDNGSSRISLWMALDDVYGMKADRKEALKLARQSLKEGKTFRYAFDDGESCNGPRKASVKMWIE